MKNDQDPWPDPRSARDDLDHRYIVRSQGSALKRMWRGEYPLVQGFWVWGFGGVAALSIVGSNIFAGMLKAGGQWLIPSAIVYSLVAIGYQAAASIGIWRSARRYEGPKEWAVFTRIAVVVLFFWIVASAGMAAYMYFDNQFDPWR